MIKQRNYPYIRTNFIVSSMIYLHWRVIRDFERDNFGTTIEGYFQSKRSGKLSKGFLLHQGNVPHQPPVALATKAGE